LGIEGNTKMYQDGSTGTVPKPGDSKKTNWPISPGYEIEESWYEQFWVDRYGTVPPPWPVAPNGAGLGPMDPENCPFPPDGSPACNPLPASPNAPRMREFDPENPVGEERRPFGVEPNYMFGGWNGNGSGSAENPGELFVGDPRGVILPEEVFGYYDGWVEHDDLASSKYHHQGDQRLGEITYPWRNTVVYENGDELPAIWGWDIGNHDPDRPSEPDQIGVAAGPYATNVHGFAGSDAGDVCILEWLTWRTGQDETSPDETQSNGHAWVKDRGFGADPRKPVPQPYHPFASPAVPLTPDPAVVGMDIGFRDYNLDGMIDQGEVRPALTENYTTDDEKADGTFTAYPWNRQRMMEDLVEAMDYRYDWDEFLDENSMHAVLCPGETTWVERGNMIKNYPARDPAFCKSMQSNGFHSGIVLLPEGVYPDNVPQRFPYSPKWYPIHNQDNDIPDHMFPDWQDERLICENCGELDQKLYYRKDDGSCYLPDLAPNVECQPAVTKSFNLHFHDLVIALGGQTKGPLGLGALMTAYAAHEYGHAWEHWPDLYDYDIKDPNPGVINCPIGEWDIMARGGLVHPSPFLKAYPCTSWIEEQDITTLLTPGVVTNKTIINYERNRQESVFYVENPREFTQKGGRERFWTWSQTWPLSEFDTHLPGPGLMIQRTYDDENLQGQAAQQRVEPFQFLNLQADGLHELEDGTDCGDAGDPWPGTIDDPQNPGNNPATVWNWETDPNNLWVSRKLSSGLEIEDIELDPGTGTAAVEFVWMPQTLPSLQFTSPPGGASAKGIYDVEFVAVDVFGATSIYIYYTLDEEDLTVDPDGANYVGSIKKMIGGRQERSIPWKVSDLDDGQYFVFARLIPGRADGDEAVSEPDVGVKIPARRSTPNVGTLMVTQVNTGKVVSRGGDLDVLVAPPTFMYDPNATFETDGVQIGDHLDIQTGGGEGELIRGVHRITAVTRNALTTATPMMSGGPSAVVTNYQVIDLTNTSRLETWEIESEESHGERWKVTGSISGEQTTEAELGVEYTTNNDELSFIIEENPDCKVPECGFNIDDRFVVVTTGVTALSEDLTVRNGAVSAGPVAVIVAVPLSGDPPLEVRFDGRKSYDPDGRRLVSYKWFFGDGSPPATGSQTVHTYQSPGVFTVTLVVANDDGKTGEAQKDIVVRNNPPFAVINAEPTSGPEPLEVEFDGTDSSDPEGGELTFEWDFGDGSATSQEPIINHTYFKPCSDPETGDFRPCRVLLEVCDDASPPACDVAFRDILVGNSNPVAVITADPLLGTAPLDVIFNASRSFDPDCEGDPQCNAALKVDWNFDGVGEPEIKDGAIDKDYVFTYREKGDYRATATVRDDKLGSGVAAVTVSVYDAGVNIEDPVAKISINPDPPQGIAPLKVDVDGSKSRDMQGPIVSYTWDWGDGTAGETGVTATHTYQRADTYQLRLTVVDTDENSNSRTRIVLVTDDEGGLPKPPGEENSPPVAVVNVDAERGPAPLTVQFSGTSSTDPDEGDDLTYSWDFGDGATGSGDEVVHTYKQVGTYFARLTVEDGNGGRGSRTQRIVVEPPLTNRAPIAYIAAGRRTGTAPLSLTFQSASVDPDGDPLTYYWESRDADTGDVIHQDSAGAAITLRFDEVGRYEVELTVTDPAGASDTAPFEIVTVTARVEPLAPKPGDGDGDDGETTGPKARFCAFGMLPGLLGSLLGLSVMLAGRRRYRP